ncbi:MAG: hypothetical protein JXN60_05485 [Lentisphaerae bacterium]|nr:hypothetical protein [Lentisphaerota bacterium]
MSYTQLKGIIERNYKGVVPYRDFFMDPNAQDNLLPELKTMDAKEGIVRINEATGNMKFVEPCWVQKSTVIEEGNNYRITENEIGTQIYTQTKPFFYHVRKYPVRCEDDLTKLRLPDPDDPERYRDVEEYIEYFSSRDYWIESKEVPGSGFFSGVWYNLIPVEELLVTLVIDNNYAHKLVDMMGEHRLRVGENLLKRGVHSLCANDDMGCTNHTWFSPDVYEEYFFPMHKRMAELCHKYGAYFHLHSHGYIMPFMDKIIETGVDIIDPVGPGDHMDLKILKEKYGDRVVFMGGLSKSSASMSDEVLDKHIESVFRTGVEGGGFICMSEGGVSPDMSPERFDFYMNCIKKYSEKYAYR